LDLNEPRKLVSLNFFQYYFTHVEVKSGYSHPCVVFTKLDARIVNK